MFPDGIAGSQYQKKKLARAKAAAPAPTATMAVEKR
jgi:hypothetical protein